MQNVSSGEMQTLGAQQDLNFLRTHMERVHQIVPLKRVSDLTFLYMIQSFILFIKVYNKHLTILTNVSYGLILVYHSLEDGVNENQPSSERDGKSSSKDDSIKKNHWSFCNYTEWKTKKVIKRFTTALNKFYLEHML